MGIGALSTAGFTCPDKAGPMTVTATAEISSAIKWLFPKGEVQVKLATGEGKEFACVTANYKITGWVGDESKSEVFV